MIKPVELYIKEFIEAGSDIISFHPEADPNTDEIIEYIKENNVGAGIAIHPDVKISDIEKYLPKVQQVIVMTV